MKKSGWQQQRRSQRAMAVIATTNYHSSSVYAANRSVYDELTSHWLSGWRQFHNSASSLQQLIAAAAAAVTGASAAAADNSVLASARSSQTCTADDAVLSPWHHPNHVDSVAYWRNQLICNDKDESNSWARFGAERRDEVAERDDSRIIHSYIGRRYVVHYYCMKWYTRPRRSRQYPSAASRQMCF